VASSSFHIKERAKDACSQDAKHVFHKERLEYQQAEYEARNVFDGCVKAYWQPKQAGNGGRDDGARSVSSNAVKWLNRPMLSERSYKFLVCAGRGFSTGEPIHDESNRSGVKRDQNPTPFHHLHLRCAGDQIPGNINYGHGGQRKPDP
jgi:hypothetical protein